MQKDKRTQKPKIWIYKDKESGESKGEATVTYDDTNAAQSAIDWFDGREFNGNQIKVSLAQRNNNWQGKKFGGPPGGMGGGMESRGGGMGSGPSMGDSRGGGRFNDRGKH